MKEIVAIIPPEDISKEVQQKMNELNSRYHASKALSFPPHITLKSFGEVSDDSEIIAGLASIADTTKPFDISMKGLRFTGSTDIIPGVYMPVRKGRLLLYLHRNIVDFLGPQSDGKDRRYKEGSKYNPHLTLVGDDISVDCLGMAKTDLKPKNFSYSFLVKNFTLIRKVDTGCNYIDFNLIGENSNSQL